MTDWPFGLLRPGKYSVILADPPWSYQGYSAAGVPQRAEVQHYQTMSAAELAALPVWRLAAPDCALFMWTISSHIPQAFDLAERWGFRYASKAFCWAKLNKNALADKKLAGDPAAYFMGLGHSTRRNSEDCFLFTRGAPRRDAKSVRELIVEPIREHSRKPEIIYTSIERLFGGPYCELFARNERLGWQSWGNERQKFN